MIINAIFVPTPYSNQYSMHLALQRIFFNSLYFNISTSIKLIHPIYLYFKPEIIIIHMIHFYIEPQFLYILLYPTQTLRIYTTTSLPTLLDHLSVIDKFKIKFMPNAIIIPNFHISINPIPTSMIFFEAYHFMSTNL
jgi:hypothetical protein